MFKGDWTTLPNINNYSTPNNEHNWDDLSEKNNDHH